MIKFIFLALIFTSITLLGFSDILEQEAFADTWTIEDTEVIDVIVDNDEQKKVIIEENDKWFITNGGEVFVAADVELTIKGEISIDWGKFTVSPGAKIITDGGHLLNHPAGVIVNDGTIRYNAAGTNTAFGNSGTIHNNGHIAFWGDLVISNSGTINNNENGSIHLELLTLNNNDQFENNGGLITISGGSLRNSYDGVINNSDNGRIYNYGEIDNRSILNNNWGIIFNLDGGDLNNTGEINNYSILNVNNQGKITNISVEDNIENNDGKINNYENGSIGITSEGTFESHNNAQIINDGQINVYCESELIGDIPTLGNEVNDFCAPPDGPLTAGPALSLGQMTDGTEMMMWVSPPKSGELMNIVVEFENAKHVNYDLVVTQNGNVVLEDVEKYASDGKRTHRTMLDSSSPVDVTVIFQGYGIDGPKTGPIGEEVVFINAIPEFGTIAMMVLAVAIISIIAVTTKSRIVPRF